MLFRQIITISLCLLLSSVVFAKPPKTLPPSVTSVIVNTEAGEMQIFGSDFADPVVSLGALVFTPPHFLSGPNELIIALPPIDPGDYKVTLSQGKNGKDQDDYDS